jgi:D-glycero-D-manno-heptose 1,7-bisphosphate phosphatase
VQLRPAIFFDRDGTLIAEAPAGLASPAAHAPEHVILLPGAIEAIALARAAGCLVVVVTNQPGPAKGQYTRADVAATNRALGEACARAGAPLDAIYVCEHHETGGPGGDVTLIVACDCRKPRPGLILAAARDLAIDLARSTVIGDSERDMAAGSSAGTHCVRVGAAGVGLIEAVHSAINQGLQSRGDLCRSSSTRAI